MPVSTTRRKRYINITMTCLETRNRAVTLMEQEISWNEIIKQLALKLKTVRALIKRHHETGSVAWSAKLDNGKVDSFRSVANEDIPVN